jgi:alpha-tubulin suppressor-like RCC1 family protein
MFGAKSKAAGVFMGALSFTGYQMNQQRQASADNNKTQFVYGWGQGIKGQLGIGTMQFGANTPSLIEALHSQDIDKLTAKGDISAVINKYGELLTWGSVRNGAMVSASGEAYSKNLEEPTMFESPDHVFKQVAVGKDHCAILTDKGRVMTMGSSGQHGKLGHEPKAKVEQTNMEKHMRKARDINSKAAVGFVHGDI